MNIAWSKCTRRRLVGREGGIERGIKGFWCELKEKRSALEGCLQPTHGYQRTWSTRRRVYRGNEYNIATIEYISIHSTHAYTSIYVCIKWRRWVLVVSESNMSVFGCLKAAVVHHTIRKHIYLSRSRLKLYQNFVYRYICIW